MKLTLLLFLFVMPCTLLHAQDSIQVATPKIITELSIGKSTDFDAKNIKFIAIKEDSRCPSDVTCMWAGQVTALLEIYSKGTLIEKKEFIFGSDAINPDHMKEILVVDQKTVYAYTIRPHPTSKQQIQPSEYYLELLIQ